MSVVKAPPLQLRCMQVFGGNRTLEQQFELPGVDAYLSSLAYGHGRGGDIHYVSTCGHGEIVRFLVADVAGHGAEVAEVAARFRALVTRNINRLDQSRLARALNTAFSVDNAGGRFITTLFVSYHRPSGHLIVCNAGHPRPLLYRARTARWQLLDHHFEPTADELLNLPLGIIESTDYRQFAVRLEPGDTLLLYTDGLCDVRDRAGRVGEERMLEAVDGAAPELLDAFAVKVRRTLGLFGPEHRPVDDETLFLVRPTERPFPPLRLRERVGSMGKMLGILPV
ncbi:MAG: PP2C family protein-serine/threonine phosphatase [Gammaproteobacteria bacterium]